MIANVAPRRASGAGKTYTIAENVGLLCNANSAAGGVPNFGVRSNPIPKLHNQRGIWNYSPLCIDWTWQMEIRHACGGCNHLVTEVAA